MDTNTTTPTLSPHLTLNTRMQSYNDYRLHYTQMDFGFEDEFVNVFPRTGYLVATLFVGASVHCKFMNYSKQEFLQNRLYLTGLFSQSSLFMSMNGYWKCYFFMVHPVIGYHILKTPMTELVDRRVAVSDVLNVNNNILRKLEENELIDSLDSEYFDQFFQNTLPDKDVFLKDPIYYAINQIIKNDGKVCVEELAKQYCMSQRTLQRQFLLKVGLCPQAYARIWKIKHAMELIQGNPKMSLSEVAFKAGYYDVAHLSHDFKNRVALPPSQLNNAMNPLTKRYLNIKPLA
ncbi:helix-turn-helix domain-containing protein [Galbibacter sp. EGI 63066]|uniref:helix-turn-helix domain-containing protein n=1 Tax=Galbibacter sp. EGI 63066 TaxID=2993559 RepID=UPI00224957BA|nr:helix-turn-helix domain-containing protein [Galbibacter sp. EGI 63066]MCX2681863.1 helix-turn-helix domain-containing protein [Galbibacter sp. EGI 63066]